MGIYGLDTCLDALQAKCQEIIKEADTAVMNGGLAYQHDVQVLAPVKTGQYRASIRTELGHETDGSPFALVGSPLPQACRLEFGFYDMTDSLGRHFFQYPRPHFRPPLDTELSRYLDIMKGTFTGDGSYDREAGMNWAADQMADVRPDLITGVFHK